MTVGDISMNNLCYVTYKYESDLKQILGYSYLLCVIVVNMYYKI